MPLFLLNIFKSKWTWIIVAVIALFTIGQSMYSTYQEALLTTQTLQQNLIAAQDSLTKEKATIQTMTSFIGDLNQKNSDLGDENEKLEGQYRAVKTKLELAIARIDSAGDATTACADDSVVTTFSGKQGIASYDVRTVLTLSTCASTYMIGIEFDEISATAELLQDEVDGLWKMKTTSLTPGVTLRGLTTIDTETLRKLRGVGLKEPERHYFGVGLGINLNYVDAGIRIKPNRWMFEADYRIADKTKQQEESSWIDNLRVGITYFLF